jgi:glycosyltransferase involved in cell wall biosynthesis
MRPLAFAIPGDIATLTGGYIYERRLLQGLRAAGHDVHHLELPASFPDPSAADMATAVAALAQVPPDRPLILDGLVFGSIDTGGLGQVRAPVVAMIHHPLALETGLTPDRRDHLFRTERDNLRLALHVVVPSPHTRRILADRYDVPPDAITVLRPGVDRPRLPPAPATPPLILSVGILHPRKCHDILLDALSLLSDLDWQAVIVGNPWDRDHAAALERQRGGSGLRGAFRRMSLRSFTPAPRSLRWQPITKATASSSTRLWCAGCPLSVAARARCPTRCRKGRACWSPPAMRRPLPRRCGR